MRKLPYVPVSAQMSDTLIQVYDLHHDAKLIRDVQHATLHRDDAGLVPENGLFGSDEWWTAIENGVIPTIEINGVITSVFMSGHNDYAEFEINDADSKTSWARQVSATLDKTLTDEDKWRLYSEGNPVRLQYANQRFKKTFPGCSEFDRCVLSIWIASARRS